MKVCKKCNTPKELDEFCKRKEEKDGLHRYCKECMKKRLKGEYIKDKEKHLKRTKKYQEENRIYFRQKSKDHYHNNKDYYRDWHKNKMDTDPLFRLRHAINALINHHLKEGKTQKSLQYLGCNIQEYKLYLEEKFTTEMNWDNYGKMWEIDHIFPLSRGGSFHYTNTQPLTILENRTKSNNIT